MSVMVSCEKEGAKEDTFEGKWWVVNSYEYLLSDIVVHTDTEYKESFWTADNELAKIRFSDNGQATAVFSNGQQHNYSYSVNGNIINAEGFEFELSSDKKQLSLVGITTSLNDCEEWPESDLFAVCQCNNVGIFTIPKHVTRLSIDTNQPTYFCYMIKKGEVLERHPCTLRGLKYTEGFGNGFPWDIGVNVGDSYFYFDSVDKKLYIWDYDSFRGEYSYSYKTITITSYDFAYDKMIQIYKPE